MKKIVKIFIAFVLFPGMALHAQRVVMHKDVRTQLLRNSDNEYGPNTRHFFSTFVSYGVIMPVNESDSVAVRENGSSNVFSGGWRYKRRLAEHFGIGLDVLYMHQSFRIKQDADKNIFSPGFQNDLQKLSFNTIGLGSYARLNIGKRGNTIGKYIDLGGDAHYVFSDRLLTKNTVSPSTNNGAHQAKTSLQKLDYVAPAQLFILARIGYNGIALAGRYRFSDIFKTSGDFYGGQKLPELPRIMVSLELTFWDKDAPEPKNDKAD